MKIKNSCLVLSALFILLGNSLALAVLDPTSGESSGDTSSGEITPIISGDISGEASGEIVPAISGDTSGDESGDVVDTPEEIIPFYYEDMQHHWANYSASHLAARGFIIGEEIGDNFYYNPEEKMTRGDFMLFLLAVLDNTSGDMANITFADEDSIPDYILTKAKVAYKEKIINGVSTKGKTYLYPEREITRAEAFVMIDNILKEKTSLEDTTSVIKYSDSTNIPSWSLQPIKNLTGLKILQGSNFNTINAHSTVTRGEAAELCYKMLKEIERNSMAK